MAKTDRTVLISNDQEFGQVADPNKLEAQITHAFDKIDNNDNEFIAHQKQVDPTSADNVRDKHVSNNDLKGLQDQITTNLNDLTTHKKQVDPTSSDTTRDKHVANNDLKTLQDQITTNNTASVNRDNAHKNAVVLDHPDQSVTTEKLKDYSVTGVKIANGAVSRNQLDPTLFEQTANASKFQEIDAQLAETVTTIAMPVKQGVQAKSPKLIIKNANNDFSVFQKTNKGYIHYRFSTANGDTSSNSVAGSWDLLRLKQAKWVNHVYLAKIAHTVISGTVSALYAPSTRNTVENELFNVDSESQVDFVSSKGDGTGIGLYSLTGTSAISEVGFDLYVGSTRKANLLVLGSSGSTTSVDIVINDEIVKTFNPSKLSIGGSSYYRIVEFEIPVKYSTSATVTVKVRNNDTTNKPLYFSCMNFVRLDQYNGESVDFYKAMFSTKYWINHGGASDYAIFDKDLGKWCGSYHGGETRLSGTLLWGGVTSNNALPKTWTQIPTSKRSIDAVELVAGAWTIVPDFKIEQRTDINGKAKMLSTFDFNVDGTLQMDCSLYDNTIKSTQLYTGLTCSSVNMTEVAYPIYKVLGAPLEHEYLKINDGRVIQRDPTNGLDLHHRFTRFGTRYNTKGAWIYNDALYYKKFYYGLIDDLTVGVIIQNVSWQKAMDFYIN